MAKNDLIAALRDLEASIIDLENTIAEAPTGGVSGVGAPGVPGAPRRFGEAPGGADAPEDEGAQSPLGAFRMSPIIAGLSTVAAGAGAVAGAGLISQARGGDPVAGGLGAINRAAAAIPVVGELGGFAGAQRAQREVETGIAAQIAEVEARGGSVTQEQREFLLGEGAEIAKRREESMQRSLEVVKQQAEAGAFGPQAVSRNDAAAALIIAGRVFQFPLFEAFGVELYK